MERSNRTHHIPRDRPHSCLSESVVLLAVNCLLKHLLLCTCTIIASSPCITKHIVRAHHFWLSISRRKNANRWVGGRELTRTGGRRGINGREHNWSAEGSKLKQKEHMTVTAVCKNTPKHHKTIAKSGFNEKKHTFAALQKQQKESWRCRFHPQGGAPGPRQLREFGGRPPITDL